MEMGDFQLRIRELRPFYAMFSAWGGRGKMPPPPSPIFRGDIFSVDTAAYGNLVTGTSHVFSLVELTVTILVSNPMLAFFAPCQMVSMRLGLKLPKILKMRDAAEQWGILRVPLSRWTRAEMKVFIR